MSKKEQAGLCGLPVCTFIRRWEKLNGDLLLIQWFVTELAGAFQIGQGLAANLLPIAVGAAWQAAQADQRW
jgi:hypothetical protein